MEPLAPSKETFFLRSTKIGRGIPSHEVFPSLFRLPGPDRFQRQARIEIRRREGRCVPPERQPDCRMRPSGSDAFGDLRSPGTQLAQRKETGTLWRAPVPRISAYWSATRASSGDPACMPDGRPVRAFALLAFCFQLRILPRGDT